MECESTEVFWIDNEIKVLYHIKDLFTKFWTKHHLLTTALH